MAFVLGGSAGLLAQSAKNADGNSPSDGAGSHQIAQSVDRQNGLNTDALGALLKEARRVILASRSAWL